MGFGGDLMMASAMRAFREKTGKRAALVHRPGFTDLLAGRLYDASRMVKADPVFAGNPDLFVARLVRRRGKAGKVLDNLFQRLLARTRLVDWLDRRLVKACYALSARKKYRLVYVDSSQFSYASGALSDRLLWKPTPNAVAGVADGFCPEERPAIPHPQPPGRFFGLEADEARAMRLLRGRGVADRPFIVIEPATNRDWFGDLRAWPLDRWQQLIDALCTAYPEMPILRVGVGKVDLKGVVDLGDTTSFREAASIISRAALFVGTEGGLMHAAAAVDAPSVIIWGGVTRPDFAGYPDRHVILFNELSCTHCGFRETCPHDAACIKGITPAFAIRAVKDALDGYRAGIRNVVGSGEKVSSRGAAA